VVLARELCLEEIEKIRAATYVQLEVFCHGALCVSASGLCLFSSFLGGASANRGQCTQACRRRFTTPSGLSGFFFSPRDLQLLERVPDLARAGVNSLKIEGRMKSADYVGAVTAAYRLVLDAVGEGRDAEDVSAAITRGLAILKEDFAREKTRYWFDGREASLTSWLNSGEAGGTGIRLGRVQSVRGGPGARQALVPCENVHPTPGDSVRFHKADDSSRVTWKLKSAEENASGGVWLDAPDAAGIGDTVYLTQSKVSSRRRPRILPRALPHSAGPGFEKAPEVGELGPSREQGTTRKLYQTTENSPGRSPLPLAAFSRLEDLYIAQSVRPAGVILDLTQKNARRILASKTPLPFKPAEITLSLSPVMEENSQPVLRESIERLISAGYRSFVVNNIGDFAFFRGKPVVLIAGPWLYTFNRWAASGYFAQGISFVITPFENNRQNLEKTFVTHRERSLVFVTVYSRPPLFHLSADLEAEYGSEIGDSRGSEFRVRGLDDGGGGVVRPETPFSLLDKTPFLAKSGFRRFILDFTGERPQKQEYKAVMKSFQEAAVIGGASRFNWKRGFSSRDGGGGGVGGGTGETRNTQER